MGQIFADIGGNISNWKGSHIESKYPGLLAQSLDAVPAVVYSKSVPDFKYLLANPMFYQVVKTPKENVLGLTDRDIFSPEVARAFSKV